MKPLSFLTFSLFSRFLKHPLSGFDFLPKFFLFSFFLFFSFYRNFFQLVFCSITFVHLQPDSKLKLAEQNQEISFALSSLFSEMLKMQIKKKSNVCLSVFLFVYPLTFLKWE